MNVFEAEIAKYQRRLERIKSSKGSKMLAANQLLYQAQLDENRELLRSWQQGVPFIGAQGTCAMLMQCFGDFRVTNLVRIADRLGTDRAESSVDKVRAMGLPDYSCDRTILFLPLAVMGADLPKMQLIVARTTGCEVINDTHRTLAHLLNVPIFTIDVPFEEPYQNHVGYVAQQLEELVKWTERHLPGARFDESRLVKWQNLVQRWYTALHDVYELRKRVPCPDHPRDVFREPIYPGQYTNPEMIVEYYESYRDELRERAARGWSPVGEEKLRIVWAITGPYGSNVWDYLVERGVSVPYWHYGGAERNFAKPTYGDLTEFGRKLTPLEEEARMALYNSWAGDAERWIKDTLAACRDFKADGLVLFEQTGCVPVQGLGQILVNRLTREVGIPAWRIEGRQLIGRTERVDAEFMSGLEAFINLCFAEKRSR